MTQTQYIMMLIGYGVVGFWVLSIAWVAALVITDWLFPQGSDDGRA